MNQHCESKFVEFKREVLNFHKKCDYYSIPGRTLSVKYFFSDFVSFEIVIPFVWNLIGMFFNFLKSLWLGEPCDLCQYLPEEYYR